MKVQILSDLHVDFKKNFGYFTNRCHPRADTLIVAGDLHPHKEDGEDCIEHYYYIKTRLLPKWKNVILIPGNHEFYGSDAEDEWFSKKIKIYEKDGNKVHYCNNHILEIGGVYFVCSTLWSHISYINSYSVKSGMNDYRQISGLTIDRMNEIHKANCDFLIDAMSKIPDGKRCVIVTHHLPSFNLISARYRNNSLNEAFAADMDTFIMMHEDKISHWIHGHSHDFVNEVHSGIRFIRNPMGYPHERHCDMDFVIDI